MSGPAAVLALQRTIGNQATARLLQRKFDTQPGPESPNRQVLDEVADGSTQLGYTFPVLNGARVQLATGIYGHLKPPEVEVAPVGARAYAGQVTKVGTNVGSYDLEYVSPEQKNGTRALPRGQLAKIIESLRIMLHGLPAVSDQDVADLNRDMTGPASLTITADFQALAQTTLAHERRHAADHLEVYRQILGPWDGMLERAHRAGAKPRVPADGREDAEEKLWQLLGGNPFDICDRIWKALVRRSDMFHATPEGAEAKVKQVGWVRDTAELSIELDAVPRGEGDISMTRPKGRSRSIIEILEQ